MTWQGGDDDILCACPGLAAYKTSPLSINNKLFSSSSSFQESSRTVVSVIFGGFWAINLQTIAAEYYKGPSDRRRALCMVISSSFSSSFLLLLLLRLLSNYIITES